MSKTITEALAEIKTVKKRLAKKRAFVLDYLWRQEGNRDPLESDGGSAKVIEGTRQSIADLETRQVEIRRAICEANLATTITVGGETNSIFDWLAWRREVSAGSQSFLAGLRQRVIQVRAEAAKQQVRVLSSSDTTREPADVVINVSEVELSKEIEALEETLGELDGLLSLKNATVLVDL